MNETFVDVTPRARLSASETKRIRSDSTVSELDEKKEEPEKTPAVPEDKQVTPEKGNKESKGDNVRIESPLNNYSNYSKKSFFFQNTKHTSNFLNIVLEIYPKDNTV